MFLLLTDKNELCYTMNCDDNDDDGDDDDDDDDRLLLLLVRLGEQLQRFVKKKVWSSAAYPQARDNDDTEDNDMF